MTLRGVITPLVNKRITVRTGKQMKVTENFKKSFVKKPKTETEDMIKKARKEGEKMVKGLFEFTEAGAGFFQFSYRFWPGEPIRTVSINHGEIVEIPLELVKHINGTKRKIKKFAEWDQANPTMARTYEKESRIKFTPTDYL